MEREIWDIVRALDENKLTAIEAHKKLCVLYNVSDTEGKLCDKCYDTDGFYLGTTCPKCNKPFRSVKA